MKNIYGIISLFLALLMLMSSCGGKIDPVIGGDGTTLPPSGGVLDPPVEDEAGVTAEVTDIGFEHVDENIETTIKVTCIEGTPNAYTLENGVLTFSGLSADSIYSVTGNLGGYVVIDAGDDHKFELELQGVIIQSGTESPIIAKSGDKVTLTAKKDTSNFIYDLREAVDSTVEGVYSGAVHSECDLGIGGKGSLTVESKNNNGIHSKDDLELKNLNLTVTAVDNALKGNDSVTVESGNIVLISRAGDGIKTSNSDISDKGNQRGDITFMAGRVDIYAACDAIDASHDVIVEGETVLNIFTDKYSEYSEEVTAVKENVYYIRFMSKDYNYSVKYSNDAGESIWKTAEFDSEVSSSSGGGPGGSRPGKPGQSGQPGKPGEQSAICYYKVDKPAGYSKMQLFVYSSDQKTEQETDYLAATQQMSVNESYDTIAIDVYGDSLRMSWTNYSTSSRPGGFGGGMGGPGGMGEGNKDKSEHSAKGIKAANEIVISGGTIYIKAYDDALHANADTALENGKAPTGNVTVSGGKLTLYSNDDGMHADGVMKVSGGSVAITNSYEGIEGNSVLIAGGSIALRSRDDGINSTATSGNGITVSDGSLFIYASGDGIDSNSRSSYQGIVFSGGRTIVISTSGGNSAIDSEQGYSYSGGYVLALMPSGGMSSEATHCKDFNSVAQKVSGDVNEGEYLTVGDIVTLKMPATLRGLVIFIGDKDAKISTSKTSDASFDDNGIAWN
ncbi:MAG: carbohydrate-binding domain-containing protein [Clostridia bacterium]|nr:carbohydrate-binding domain-containing protein [Clostridia bacterium]